ncbi:MAG: pyridoxal-phosphate dependent enzyme [Saprospiraceae bacterium]|nr:pyridoxal-phosphate dependent enzyme [Saprospiraceae bacterium]
MQVLIKRDDLLHPSDDLCFCGNKWRKLKYNLIQAKAAGYQQLLTFGGAYSNHIAALASAGKLFGFSTVGIIRGEEHLPLNPTLQHAHEQGMHIHYMSRSEFRRKQEAEVLRQLEERFGPAYVLPEGGTNASALQGVEELVAELRAQTVIDERACVAVSCGTGGTMAGIILGMAGQGQVMGFPALKGDFMAGEVEQLLAGEGTKWDNWTIQADYHFGGYAKHKPELVKFMVDFSQQYGVKLDPIYTSKLFYGVFDLIEKGAFEVGTKVIVVHTGGLQGIRGWEERFGTGGSPL